MRPSATRWRPLIWILVVLAAPASAQQERGRLTAQVTLTSDYVYRGLSQSREDPAIQGGFHYQRDGGLFAGVWASSVDFLTNRDRTEPRDLEVDYYLGYARDLAADWSASAQITRYSYPGDDPAFDYDYNELALTAQFRDLLAASVHLSNDIFGRGERAIAYELSGRAPLGGRFDGLAGVGRFDLDRIVGDSYTYWNLGVSWTAGRFVLDLAYFDTSSVATALFGDEVAAGRLVATVTAHMD